MSSVIEFKSDKRENNREQAGLLISGKNKNIDMVEAMKRVE